MTETTFEQEVIKSETPVIVDFWAEWCGPCHAVSPVLDRIAEERADELKLVKVNIDEERSLAERYGIASIPTMILFRDGEPSAAVIGAQPKGAIERSLGLTAALEASPLLSPREARHRRAFASRDPARRPALLPRVATVSSRVSPRHVPASVTELSRVELLSSLPGQTLARLAERMEREEVPPGRTIVSEGEEGDRFYVLLSGLAGGQPADARAARDDPAGRLVRRGGARDGRRLARRPSRR